MEGTGVAPLSADYNFGPVEKPNEGLFALDEVTLLAPVVPSKVVCVGRNYREHAAELGNKMPDEPLLFLKAPSAVIAPDEEIVLPEASQQVEHEGELGVVIGRTARKLSQQRRSSQLCLWLHVRERRDCARSSAKRCSIHSRQVVRHILPGRALD